MKSHSASILRLSPASHTNCMSWGVTSALGVTMRGTEYPVSRRTRTAYCVEPHEMIIVVIGLLPQCDLVVDFSGEAGFVFCLLHYLSSEVSVSGSSGPFHFWFVPQAIGKDLGCSVPCPIENPGHPARLASRLLLLPACCHPRFLRGPPCFAWQLVPLGLLPPFFFSHELSLSALEPLAALFP